jgi:hypothetical protein
VSSGILNYLPYPKIQKINVMSVPNEQELKKGTKGKKIVIKG